MDGSLRPSTTESQRAMVGVRCRAGCQPALTMRRHAAAEVTSNFDTGSSSRYRESVSLTGTGKCAETFVGAWPRDRGTTGSDRADFRRGSSEVLSSMIATTVEDDKAGRWNSG
jgi:hypothetical protein